VPIHKLQNNCLLLIECHTLVTHFHVYQLVQNCLQILYVHFLWFPVNEITYIGLVLQPSYQNSSVKITFML
jgi:hypothetical protein